MIDHHLQVSDLGEKKLIERILEKSESLLDFKNFLNNKDNIPYIGDDAALIDFSPELNNSNYYLVATSDLLIESCHFPKEMSYFQMGWKSVIVNLSDLAAMGSKPRGILINLAIPKNLKIKYFDELIDGILNACSYYKIPLLGGDTNQAEEIIISGTAIGEVEKGKVLCKNEFGKGDLIGVTGELGLAALGFELFNSQYSSKIEKTVNNNEISEEFIDLAIEKTLKPMAKIDEGIFLSNYASSATDITDGLASELYELFKSNKINYSKSKLGLKIYEEKLPFFNEISKISKLLDKNPLELILHIGEDFELLFIINKDKLEDMQKNNNPIDYYIIGEVNDRNKVEIEFLNGNIKELSSKGYEHLL